MILDKIKAVLKKVTHSKYISNVSPNTVDMRKAIVVNFELGKHKICLN